MKVGVGQRMMKECILAMMLQHIKLFRPAYRVLTRIEPGLTLWRSLHIQNQATNAGGYEEPTQQQQWAQAEGDFQGDSSASEQSWQPEAGDSQEWPTEQEAVETQAWQQPPEDIVEWAKEAEQLSAQNGEAIEQQERKEPAEWDEPAEWSKSGGPDGSSAEVAANAHSAPEWVERLDDFKDSASGDSEWSANPTWKESAQEWPAEAKAETSAGNSWQSEQADAWQQDTLDINPSEPAGEYATPEAEWASPATASSDEAQLWQVGIPPILLGHLLQISSLAGTKPRTKCQGPGFPSVFCICCLCSVRVPGLNPSG